MSDKIGGGPTRAKKRMKSIGKINIPQEAFIEVLKAQ
jgi:translation elongation factor EF-4